MMITLDVNIYEELVKSGLSALPNEACGLLAGVNGKIEKFYPMTNADASSEHYQMLPEEQFAAVKDMRKNGTDMLAIWHSHPATPARMSEEDLKLAFTPDTVYMILSLMDAGKPSLRAFRIEEGKSVEVDVVVESMKERVMEGYYSLPAGLEADIESHASDVRRFVAGDLAPAIFKAKRVPRGIYEQRHDGTYMMRVRVAGGQLKSGQAAKVAEIGRQFGNGLLHATTRQDVQLHDVKITDSPEIMRALKTVGLTSKGGGGNTVRNVAACPYAGICKSEWFDVAPYAHAVTEYLIQLEGSYNLPRKYKIAFSGCGADCALARANDLGFIAKVKDGKPGFEMYAGGGMGAHSRLADQLADWVPATDVIRISEAVRRIFDRTGDRHNRNKARLRYVFEKIGAEAFKVELDKELKNVAGEGVRDAELVVKLRNPESCRQPECEVAEGGVRFMRQHQDGYVAVILHLPLGFVSCADFGVMADAASKYSDEQSLRMTRSQDVVIGFVKETSLEELQRELSGLSEDMLTPSPIEHFVACAGASTCRLGLCLSRNVARACADAFKPAERMAGLQINISGCPNACGQHPMAQVGFFGTALRHEGRMLPGYKVVLGARDDNGGARFAEIVGTVPARALPGLMSALAEDYSAGRSGDEMFSEYFSRKGNEYFTGIVKLHESIPSYEEHPDFYRDWGKDEEFSLAGRGAGECGAGVFEVISGDIATARKSLKLAESGADDSAVGVAFLATVRALLIARGIDTSDLSSVLAEFEKQFVQTGLMGSLFDNLQAKVKCDPESWSEKLKGSLDDIKKLLDRVEMLYNSMDANLQFHVPEECISGSAEGGVGPAGLVEEMDLRGVACPMNFVKAKIKMETISMGNVLAIVLDDGDPVRNVPVSFESEGQEVVSIRDLHDGHWRVEIKKKK